MSVFDGSLTTPLSASYAILLDSFDSSIQELAQLLSLALPTGTEAEARTAFVAKLVSEARRATGAQEEEAEGDQEAPVPVAEDPKAKVTVLQHVAAAIDAQDVSLMSQKDLTSFTSLYLSLMLPLNPPNVNLVAQLQRIVDCLSETEALTTIYNILPSSQSTFKPLKCTLLQKIIAASKHTKTQSLAVQHFLQSDLLSPESAQSITNTLLQDDSELALDFVSKLPAHAANERLHRCAFRLQLAKPAAFRFSSAAASLPESSLLAALFEHKPLDDKLLQVDGLPALNKDSLLVKQRSLALAEALAKGGDKVPYSEVRKILGENVDEEALEGAVIDAIKAKLLTARLNSTKQEINVTSIAPYIAIRSAYQASTSGGKGDLEDWKLVKTKLDALRKSMDEMMAGLQTVLPSGTEAPQVNGSSA